MRAWLNNGKGLGSNKIIRRKLMTKGKKVDYGMRCGKCNHKISDKSLLGKNGEGIEKSGVCQSCRNYRQDICQDWLFVWAIEGSGKYELVCNRDINAYYRDRIPTLGITRRII